jgi:hypothetical protein
VNATFDTKAARAGLTDAAAAVRQAIALSLREAVRAAEKAARGTVLFRDRTGGTRGSIRGEAFDLRGVVSAAGATRFLECGTNAHTITARRAKALRFVSNGEVVFRRSVRHPGTRPRPFMREAREIGEVALHYEAERFLGYAIRRL